MIPVKVFVQKRFIHNSSNIPDHHGAVILLIYVLLKYIVSRCLKLRLNATNLTLERQEITLPHHSDDHQVTSTASKRTHTRYLLIVCKITIVFSRLLRDYDKLLILYSISTISHIEHVCLSCVDFSSSI